jgi:hypothetical protein
MKTLKSILSGIFGFLTRSDDGRYKLQMWGFREEMEAGLVLCPVLGWGCGRTR